MDENEELPLHHPAERAGYHDALRGHTACPEGVPEFCERWAKGHDYAFDKGLAKLPRFLRFGGKARR